MTNPTPPQGGVLNCIINNQNMNEPFNKGLITGTISKLAEIRHSLSTGEEEKEKASFCISVLQLMRASDDVWNVQCPYNYEKIGDSFNNMLLSINSGSIDFNNEFLICCIRFLIEKSLYLKRVNKNDEEINNLVMDARRIATSDEDKLYFSYVISDAFKIDILNRYIGYIGGEDFQAFLNYEKYVEEIKGRLKTSLEEINEAKEEASRIAKILEEQKITGTFVELEKGFSLMLDRIKKAKNWTFGWLLAISAIIIAIPTARIFYPIAVSDASIWEKLVPLIGVELILIYFFRVTLKHYYSLQTQIMQLDFRYSLCQFIGAYSEYSRKIKEANGNALDKFESLIFSNLLSESDNIPSTFDGLDNLASLINNMRGK